MNTHQSQQHEAAQNNCTSLSEQLTPLNFDIKHLTNSELDSTIANVKPTELVCGLCFIVIGSG